MPKFLVRLLALAVMLWSAFGAFGAETGTLRGSVRDASNDAPLEGVQVSVEGSGLPGGRTRTSDSRGNFWFPVLPPGDYRVTFTREGYQTRGFDATVRLDQTTTLPPVKLSLLTYTSEVIEIVETSPVIDNTQSAIVENVGEDYFDRLPVARSYQGVIRTLPGVQGRIDYQDGGPSDGNPSVRGEGRYGNNYLLEGFSVRDPVEKTTGPDIPFEAMQEITVYTDGAPAEFGNFTGLLANMVLKSGQNDPHGTLSYIVDTNASGGTYRIMDEDVEKRTFFFQTPVITLGGPIVKDKIWFLSTLDYRTGHQQLEGADIQTDLKHNYMFMSKFTYNPFVDSSTLINFIVQKQGLEVGSAGADAATAPEATVDGFDDLLSLNANLKSVLSPYVVFEAKWNRWLDRYYSNPSRASLYDASYTDLYTGYVSNNTSYLYSSQRERQGFAFHLTTYLTEALGQHVIKGGYEFHRSGNEDEFLYTGGQGTEDDPAYEYLYLDENGDHVLQSGEEYSRTAHYNVGPLAHSGVNNVFFLQDQWQPISSLTLNLGVRVDTETLLQNAGRQVLSQWVYAPRFGVAWDVTQDSKNVATANAGRYYDVNGLSFADWADTRSSNYYTQCEWDPETQDYDLNCFTQDPVGSPLEYSQGLKPYHLDKFTLGFSRAVTPTIAVGLKGIISTTRNLPEDTQTEPGQYSIVNPELKRRDYWAVELTAQRKFTDNWQLLAAVTYSHSKGTNAGSFEAGSAETTGGSGNDVGVFMDDIANPYLRLANDYFYGWDFAGLGYNSYRAFGQSYEGSSEGWYGYLPYHSFVNVKLNGSYRFNFGTELGLVYEFDSGHAWQRRGLQELYGAHYVNLEGRGARFMPPVHYIDLRVAHEFSLPRSLKLRAELNVLNLFDFEQAVSYYENYNPSEDVESGLQVNADGNYCHPETNEDGSVSCVESSFGKVLYRQAPRAVRANLTLAF